MVILVVVSPAFKCQKIFFSTSFFQESEKLAQIHNDILSYKLQTFISFKNSSNMQYVEEIQKGPRTFAYDFNFCML